MKRDRTDISTTPKKLLEKCAQPLTDQTFSASLKTLLQIFPASINLTIYITGQLDYQSPVCHSTKFEIVTYNLSHCHDVMYLIIHIIKR